jgi:hypothetical protein
MHANCRPRFISFPIRQFAVSARSAFNRTTPSDKRETVHKNLTPMKEREPKASSIVRFHPIPCESACLITFLNTSKTIGSAGLNVAMHLMLTRNGRNVPPVVILSNYGLTNTSRDRKPLLFFGRYFPAGFLNLRPS